MSFCQSSCCRNCINAAKWIPVLFIMSIVVWSYFAYVYHVCLVSVTSLWEQVLLLVLYHFFLVMFVWSYWRTVFTPPGSVPSRFFLTHSGVENIETANNMKVVLDQVVINKDLPCTMRTIQQEVRFCSECSLIKPDRAHHCGVCGQCVLKLDHHCPWVNNCVAFMNYKFFVLFLGYGLLYCIYVALSTLKYFLGFWSSISASSESTSKFQILFLFFVSVMFSVSLASLFFYHLYLVYHNTSTLEAFRTPIMRHGPDKLAFHLGAYNNFQEVFGDNRWTWFVPVFTSFGDGVNFPQRGVRDEETGLLGESNGGISPNSEERMPMMSQEDETVTLDASRHVSSSSGSDHDFRNNGSVRVNANGNAHQSKSDMSLVNM